MEGGFYALDTWKLTRKLTLNYGLRWDLEQMQHEQHERETQFSPTVVNPSAGGLLGGTEYEGYGTGRCNCIFEKFYPWMIQPRLGVSYQLDPKTVIHAATGLYSGPQLFMNEEIYSNQGFGFNQVFLTSPSYGIPAGQLSNGIPYSPAALTATDFDPGAYPNIGQTNSPPPFIVPNNGRPPRFVQSTVSIEREIANNLSIKSLLPQQPWCLAQFRRPDEYDKRTHSSDPLTEIWIERYQPERLQPADAADLFSLPWRQEASPLRTPPSRPEPPWLRHCGHSRNSAALATTTSTMAIGGTTRFKSRSPSGSATDCRAASVTRGRRIWEQSPAPELTPRRCRYRIPAPAQEREILCGHRPAADAQLLLQLRGAAIQLLAERVEARPACGLDRRRHLPLPERFSDTNTEFDEHSDFGDFCQWSLGESRSGPEALPAQPQQPPRQPPHHVLSQPRCVVKPGPRDLRHLQAVLWQIIVARDTPTSSWASARSSRSRRA